MPLEFAFRVPTGTYSQVVLIAIDVLHSFQRFCGEISKHTHVAQNRLELGYTLAWKKPPRRDIEKGHGITVLNNNEDLSILLRTIEAQLEKLKSQKINEKMDLLTLARSLEIEIHDLAFIQTVKESKTQGQ